MIVDGQRHQRGTLELLSELTPEQLAQPLRNMPWTPMAPTVADLFLLLARHERGHHQLVVEGWASRAGPAQRCSPPPYRPETGLARRFS